MEFFSLNQLVNVVETICQSHPQISDFGVGEEYDISTTQELYPLAWVVVKAPSIAEKTLTIPLAILIVDKRKEDSTNDTELLSDTLSIAQDIYASLTAPAYDDFFSLSGATFDKMSEALPDNLNGWRMTINFELAQTKNRCQVPT